MDNFNREFMERETGSPLTGDGIELSFREMGETGRSLNKRVGKVGFKTSMTEFFKAAKRRVRAENPIAPNQADIVKWVLYDRFQFPPGSLVPANFKFFTQPIGSNNKTKVDTNMDQVQRLSDPLWFNTEGIGFFWGPLTSPIDIADFLALTYMEYWVGQKVYIEGPMNCFPGGGGVYGVVSTESTTGTGSVWMGSNGIPRTDNVFDLRLPAGIHLGVDANNAPIITDGLIGITILQGQQFRIEMNAPGGGVSLTGITNTPIPGAGLQISAYLYGILSRGVQ